MMNRIIKSSGRKTNGKDNPSHVVSYWEKPSKIKNLEALPWVGGKNKVYVPIS